MLSNLGFTLLAFLGFGFVIAIHEFGHFLMAKWAGVRVEVFSIGFGPKLLSWRRGETEYTVSLLPLGGYVKMTGQEDLPEDPNAPPAPPDPASYLSASPGWRAVILLGGVLFNLLSSVIILLILAWWGYPTIRPVVGDVATQYETTGDRLVDSPASRLGVHPGDLVVAMNGQPVRSFDDIMQGTIAAGEGPVTLTIRRPGEAEERTLPASGTVTAIYSAQHGLPILGISPATSNRVEDLELPPPYLIPADGPQPGDRIFAIDGQPLPDPVTGQAIDRSLRGRYGQRVTLEVEDRNGIRRSTAMTYAGTTGGLDGTLGLPVRVSEVLPGWPAERAGLLPGDVIAGVGGVVPCGKLHFLGLVASQGAAGSITLAVVRNGRQRELAIATQSSSGSPMIGCLIGPVDEGPLEVIAPAVDGKPSAAAAAGLTARDSIVSHRTESGELSSIPLSPVQLWVVSGGERILVPLSKEGRRRAAPDASPSRLARLLGGVPAPSIADQLVGCRVVSLAGPDGKATGAPEPGLIQLATADGSPRTVDLRPLGADTAAFYAAVQPGDWITGLTGKEIASPAWAVLRGATGEPRRVELAPRLVAAPLHFLPEQVPYRLRYPAEALVIASHEAHAMIVQSLKIIPRFFQSADHGGLSAGKSLQGPIGIFSELRARAERSGIASWLHLVALIGLNLVLVNLLPIPITDGGQLVILGIETAIRRPLNPLVKTIVAWAGLLLVAALMLFVIGLDVSRL